MAKADLVQKEIMERVANLLANRPALLSFDEINPGTDIRFDKNMQVKIAASTVINILCNGG